MNHKLMGEDEELAHKLKPDENLESLIYEVLVHDLIRQEISEQFVEESYDQELSFSEESVLLVINF